MPGAAPVPPEIAKALGLPEDASADDAVKAIEKRLKDTDGVDAGDLADVVRNETEALRAEMAAMRAELANAAALAHSVGGNGPPGARLVDVVELASAAGGGIESLSEDVIGRAGFRRDWLNEHGLDPTRCVVIGVQGESMEPTLMDGAQILVDRARTDWRPETILVVRTGDGLVVKRAGEDADGNRLLLSDHPAWAPARLPIGAEVIGRVVWTARTLIKEMR